MGMLLSEDISFMLGFNAGANWEVTPIPERKYDPDTGECVNPTRRLNSGDEGYQDPYEALVRYRKGEV